MPEMPRTATWHLPVADVETAPYWEATSRGVLLLKHCAACDHTFFYPRDHCPRCWSTQTEWLASSGRGRVYTFTVIHTNDLPPFRDRLPYVVAVVELEEGPRMTTNIEGIEHDEIRCDMPVVVSFREEQRDGGSVFLPVFVPA